MFHLLLLQLFFTADTTQKGQRHDFVQTFQAAFRRDFLPLTHDRQPNPHFPTSMNVCGHAYCFALLLKKHGNA